MRKDNRGSGIITVLVIVMLITALGGSMLFLSHSVYQIRAVDRGSKQNYYTAEAAMNRISVTLQNAVNVAIREAYTEVLEEFGSTRNAERQTKFANEFIDSLVAYSPSPGVSVFSISGGAGGYDITGLALFAPGDNVTLIDAVDGDIYTAGQGVVSLTGDAVNGWETVTLEGVSLSCNINGYVTVLSSDIVIRVPEFAYYVPEFVLSDVYDYITVASGTLTLDTGARIVGNTYVGGINLDIGRELTLDNGTVICGGEVVLGNTSKMTSNSEIWAERFRLGKQTEIALLGDTYVADDLQLNGDGAKATLGNNSGAEPKGNYYGFGSSDSDPSNSSSIIVNGQAAELDLTGLESMMLAGYSYLKGNSSASLNMYSSMTLKSDQTVFLAPESLLKITSGNPSVLDEDSLPSGNPLIVNNSVWTNVNIKLDLDAPLPHDETKKLRDYGITGENPLILSWPLRDGYVNYMVYYVLLEFPDVANANNYFKDYLSANSSRMRSYYDQFLGSYSVGDFTRIARAGMIYSDSFEILNPRDPGTLGNNAERFQDEYNRLSSSLSKSGADTGSPFETFVQYTSPLRTMPVYDSSDVTTEQRFLIKDEEGIIPDKTVAIAVNNVGGSEFLIDGRFLSHPDYKDVSVIIATGDVKVTELNYHGLIICDGDLTLGNGVTLESDNYNVSEAFQKSVTEIADAYGGVSVVSLTNFINDGSGGGGGGGGGGRVSWNLKTVVNYGGWDKNPEG